MILKIFEKHREGVMYLVFGAFTTAVNFIVSFILERLSVPVEINTAVAWTVAVLFAYITNRKWVFNARSDKILREIMSFYGARVATGVVDVILMTVGVRWLGLWFWGVKIVVSVLVIILNYFASKYFVFRKKNKDA